jgi:hypothetical protein
MVARGKYPTAKWEGRFDIENGYYSKRMEIGERKAEIFVNSNVTCSPSVWKCTPVLPKKLLARFHC